MNYDYDLIIIGAGLVGTSLIAALQDQDLRIAILEKHLPNIATQAKADQRPLTLSYGSHLILQNLNLWSKLATDVCPINTVHVSEQGRFGSARFRAEEQKVDALGYVIPFDELKRVLYQHAASKNNVEFITSEEILNINCGVDGATVTFKNINGEQVINAKLLVAADGSQSTCRDLLNIRTQTKNYNETALIATLQLQKQHQNIAYQRFVRQGVIALLPLFDNHQYRLVWTMSKTQVDQITQWDELKLKEYFTDCFGYRVGQIRSVKIMAQFPLQMIIATEQVRPSFVLLGNAAHTIYPLAAQGFNLGLRDVAVLSEILIDVQANQQFIGDVDVLQKYFAWRKMDQKNIIRLTDGISNLFDWQLPGFGKIRGLGLLALDLITPLKKRFAKSTMGMAGRLPKLMRG